MSEETQRQRCVVEYQIATYSGEEIVYCDANDEDDFIKGKAERQLKQRSGGTSFPYGTKQFKIIEREDYFGD